MNNPQRGRIIFVSVVLAGLALTACSGGGAPISNGAQLSTGPVSSAKPLCPDDAENPPSGDDCTVYTQDQRHADNTHYRDQMPVTAEVQAQLDTYVGPVRTALEALEAPASVSDVVEAIASSGLDRKRVQANGGHGAGVAFGAGATGGCVVGGVDEDGTVRVSAGGYIYDGGCLAAVGH